MTGAAYEEEREWYHGEQAYTGEALDAVSARVVRRELSRRMHEGWSGYWVAAMNKVNRNRLVYSLMRKLDDYWREHAEEHDGDPAYSAPAVAEEADWYLPKTFWHFKRKRTCKVVDVVLDVDGDTFSKWDFAYEETRDRLRAERGAKIAANRQIRKGASR